MNCRHCGSAYPGGALFCGECGRSVALADGKRAGRTREAWLPDLMRISKAKPEAQALVAPVVDDAIADAVRLQREMAFAARAAAADPEAADADATPPVAFLDSEPAEPRSDDPDVAAARVPVLSPAPKTRPKPGPESETPAAAPATEAKTSAPVAAPREVASRTPRPSRQKAVAPAAEAAKVESNGPEKPVPAIAVPAPVRASTPAPPVESRQMPVGGARAAVPPSDAPVVAPEPNRVDPSAADMVAFAAPVPAASHREVTAAPVTVLPDLPAASSGPAAPIVPVPDFGTGDFEDSGPVDLEETRIAGDIRAANRYILQFSTGESVTVRGSGLIGRNPAAQPGEYLDQIIPLFDAGRSVSKTHLEFGQESGRFWVLDRYSTNGTVIRTPDQEAQVCEPNRRYLVARGSRIDIGEQFFVVS